MQKLKWIDVWTGMLAIIAMAMLLSLMGWTVSLDPLILEYHS